MDIKFALMRTEADSYEVMSAIPELFYILMDALLRVFITTWLRSSEF